MPFEPRFGQAADAYSVFRPEYPPQLFERILAALPPDRRHRAMDLGAGTGRTTRALLDYFDEVIAVEADALMAEKLRKAAPQALIRITTAEECHQEPASIDLVNVATALHWMDVPRVIANVELWLRPAGIFAVYGGPFPRTPEPIKAIIRQEFHEHWDTYRDERLRRKEFPQSIIRAASVLHLVEDTTIPYVLPVTPHEFAGFCRSTSYGSAFARTLSDPDAYWRDLEERFRQAWPDAKIPVDFKAYLLLARKG